jgi:thioredoxin reductase (NADPH)
VSELEVAGLFVAVGHTPNSDFVKDIVNLNSNGYIITDAYKSTNITGIWACGDVQDPHYKQAITAAGTGCMYALEVEKFLNTH